MVARGNGIISASKPILRNWRDVRNGRRVFCVSGGQERLPAYLPSTCNSLVQRRWASAGKTLVYEDKHRIPSSNIPATAATGSRKGSALSLRTLKQSRLTTEDFTDFSGRLTKTVRFPAAPEEATFQMRYYGQGIPFPPESHGFFYWHLEPDAPPASGHVRFRTTASSDPASFPTGRDLQLPDGRIWHISLSNIALRSQYSGLRAHLLSETLVTEKVLDLSLNRSAVHQEKHSISESNTTATGAAIPVRQARQLRALDQTRLNSEDFLDLTGRLTKTVHFHMAPEEPSLEMRYFRSGGRNMPFPPDCEGFLYWHLNPDVPPASGQVRFRTTTSSDTATFPSGRDLQLPNGQTWNIPLFRIARESQYSGLCAHLLAEKLLTAKMLDTALNIASSSQDRPCIRKSGIAATGATGPRKGLALLLRRLNQAELAIEDFVDLTGRLTKTVHFHMAPEDPSLEMRYFQSGGRKTPFPPDSQGFLYWHLNPDAPPVSGQVRFRTTTSSDTATFPSGRDLQLPNGRTWNIPLFRIARGSQYSGLRAHLLAERLVTQKVLDTVPNTPASSQYKHDTAKSDIPAAAAPGLCKGSVPPLRTLNQTRLAIEDFVDNTGLLASTVCFPGAPEELRFQMRYYGQGIPFPPHSHGFLYWHLESGAPPVSGQVRFRTTTSSDPATFPTGRDLQQPDGGTWNIPLSRIARQSGYSGLRAQLLFEKLVTAKVLDTTLDSSASNHGKHSIPKPDNTATAATGLHNGSALSLRTLIRTRLDVKDFVDPTGRLTKTVHFPAAPEEPSFQMRYYGQGIPFPPESHGFFYWHLEPNAPPASGQIRFRTTTSSDPAAFQTGRDLQLPDGRMWHISLSAIARRSQYSGLHAYLLSEELIAAKVLKAAVPATTVAALRTGSTSQLHSLNPGKLEVEDFVDMTGLLMKPVRFPLAPGEPSFEMRYYKSGRRDIPFPSGSQGFLYWHLEPDAPPVSGQVRFRTTRSSDPATFPRGRDLRLPNGRTWNVSPFDIACRAKYSGIRAHLLSEKLVTTNVLDTALNMSTSSREKMYRPDSGSLIIWKFGQRFFVDLPNTVAALWIIGNSTVERLTLPSLFAVLVRDSETAGICYVLSQKFKSRVSRQTGRHDFLSGVDYTPFAGRALVQFERSTLPEHKGTRTVVLRILKVMTKSDGSDDASWTPEPQEDGLDMTGMQEHCSSVDVDKPQPGSGLLPSSAKALRILFDNEALQESKDGRGAKS
ncbi:hypothetical protein OE88DRAFT_1812065 [Heliocybe sulcata]|uniref:Uncharacterized protein n=1 Tax=Heliocybe sulcata TaxID=5364 RepID=A0A5C3MLN2_9AGAM|nr:hypothetical protein OE88DRAFT_1812065 [Heliocybe sulcata]